MGHPANPTLTRPRAEPVKLRGDRELAYLTEVDHHDHEALIAASEHGEPLGVARYVRLKEDPSKAEVAVVDHWHGRGVATALLERLVERAREEGVIAFTALVLATNRKVIDLMRSFGPTKSTGLEPGVVMLEIELLDTKGLGVFLQGALREAATGALEGRDPALRQPRARARPRSG